MATFFIVDSADKLYKVTNANSDVQVNTANGPVNVTAIHRHCIINLSL